MKNNSKNLFPHHHLLKHHHGNKFNAFKFREMPTKMENHPNMGNSFGKKKKKI